MKSFSFLKLSTSLVAFAALVLTTSLQAAAPGVEAGKAVVVSTKGLVTGKSGALKVGDVLNQGDTVTTGADSEVIFDLGENGKDLKVIEKSDVVFEKLQFRKADGAVNADTTLNLKKGGLIGNVKKLSAASNYEVKHAEGVAGIRGTKYAVLPGKGVVCAEGKVVVTFTVNGVKLPPITLLPGQMVLPPVGGQPPQVVNIPVEVANFLAIAFRRDDDRGPRQVGGPRNEGPRPSANVGVGVEVEVEQAPNNT
jgi:hypothetical protein